MNYPASWRMVDGLIKVGLCTLFNRRNNVPNSPYFFNNPLVYQVWGILRHALVRVERQSVVGGVVGLQ